MEDMSLSDPGVILALLGLMFIVIEFFVLSYGLMALTGVLLLIMAAIVISAAVPTGVVWGLAVLFVLLVIGAGVLIFRVQKKQTSTGKESMVGTHGQLLEWHSTHGRVRVQGEIWKAESNEPLKLKAGDTVTISAVNDLTVKIIEG